MTLYEIDSAINNWEPEVDESTGELLNGSDLDNLEMAREEKLENAACAVKNLRADAKAHRDEAANQLDIAKSEEKRADGFEQWLDHVLDGQKFETGKCKVSYRHSTALDVDEESFIAWAEKSGHDELLNYKEPTVAKREVTSLIKSGHEYPHCRLTERRSINIK